ncbi:MAG: hypothetical protein P4L64_14700 [Caulobacteraceae bacterium]|nr:hypothetical protein [Caulobacteraceae bacterium]
MSAITTTPDVGATLTAVIAAITAIGGLGVAAAGLVDATKAFGGGVSNFGFGRIEAALKPFQAALVLAESNWAATIRANWINGAPKEDQKAAAKSLIRLGLSSDNADAMAKAGHVDAAKLKLVLTAIETGAALTPDQVNLLGRFNAAIDAAMDGGFEQADQQYRNASKLLSGVAAIGLAVWGGDLLHGGSFPDYVGSADFGKAFLVGIIAVPLAPVAKDLTSSLQAAVTALKAVKG